MRLRVESRPINCFNGFIDMKNTENKYYFNQNNYTHNNISAKSCPHGLKS